MVLPVILRSSCLVFAESTDLTLASTITFEIMEEDLSESEQEGGGNSWTIFNVKTAEIWRLY